MAIGKSTPNIWIRWGRLESVQGFFSSGRGQVFPSAAVVSCAIQHTAALVDARFMVAVNKNPNATMMKLADVALMADANQACSGIIRALKQRIRD